MKRFFLLMFIAVLGLTTVDAQVSTYYDVSVLPDTSKTFLKEHFSAKVSSIKVNENRQDQERYKVFLNDETMVRFLSLGRWKEITAEAPVSVPLTVLPQGAADYLNTHHKGVRIKRAMNFDRGPYDRRAHYIVYLEDGTGLVFKRNGRLDHYIND